MIREIKKKLIDKFINNYFISRFLNHNQKYSISKKVEIIDHYIWWFNNKREFTIYKLSGDKYIYLWAELIVFKKNKYWTCGFHTDSKTNIIEIIKSYKRFLGNIKRKKTIPIIGLIVKNNVFLRKLNEDIGFKKIQKNNHKDFLIIKSYYKIKNTSKYIFFKL